MSKAIVTHQLFEYSNDIPFRVNNIGKDFNVDDHLLVDHWHSEMEVVYTFCGHSKHYVDGVCYEAKSGDLLLINPESIHNIIPDKEAYEEARIVAVVLIVSYEFLKHILPDIGQSYFVNGNNLNMKEIANIMIQISEFGDMEQKKYDYLLIRGLVYQLFYWLSKDCLEERNLVLPVNHQKNIERLRGIIQYVHEHYKEHISQQLLAKEFYFTKEYFSRFFKKKTGMTFIEYLTKYRVYKAREELLSTDKTILEIAMNNGFADARAFINAFKSFYQTTPLQYRLKNKKE